MTSAKGREHGASGNCRHVRVAAARSARGRRGQLSRNLGGPGKLLKVFKQSSNLSALHFKKITASHSVLCYLNLFVFIGWRRDLRVCREPELVLVPSLHVPPVSLPSLTEPEDGGAHRARS